MEFIDQYLNLAADLNDYLEGRIGDEASELIDSTQEALKRALVDVVKPGARLGDLSHAIQTYAESNGFSVVRDYVGHGIGREMHEDPEIPNFGRSGRGPKLTEGMVLAIEPMINIGDYDVKVEPNGWTVVTKDGTLSAHYENTVAIMENGPEILTLG